MPDVLTPISFDELAGWKQADHAVPFDAFRRSAAEILHAATGFRRLAQFGGTRDDWRSACLAALEEDEPRRFFETYFQPFRVHDIQRPAGLFTGYYEPLVKGSLTPGLGYPVPVYAKPYDLVTFTFEEAELTGLSYGRRSDGQPVAYDTRQDIENGSLAGKSEVICWLSDWVDAFFMHVQGQGRVQLPDGSAIRLSYAGKTGHPYTGIGHVLVESGFATSDKMSMQVLRDWMRQHPDEARALMWRNKSYIFFQRAEVNDNSLGGIGAAKVNLTPLHSLAVDRRYWMFGTPLWVDTFLPPEIAPENSRLSQLMIAQDTGSAIKGVVRGDFFWGWGEVAAQMAGHMKSAGSMVAFLPLPVAKSLGHTQ